MTTALWIALGLAILVVLGYVLSMRNLWRKSRELDKQIDLSKIRPWKNEEDKDR